MLLPEKNSLTFCYFWKIYESTDAKVSNLPGNYAIVSIFLIFVQHTCVDKRLIIESAAAAEAAATMSGLRDSESLTRPVKTRLCPRKGAMVTPQGHRDHRDNPQSIAGDGLAPALRLHDGDSCETKPIVERIRAQGSGAGNLTPDTRPLTPGLRCETKPIWGQVNRG